MKRILRTFLVALVVIGIPAPGKAQTEQKPGFEVVSIKTNKSGALEPEYRPVIGGRLTVNNVTLKALIIAAYHLGESQVSGGPGWIGSDRFDINAKAERDVPLNEALQMLQTVLTDRFKLVSHRETKDITGYALSVGNAPKLKPSAGGESGIKTVPKGQGVAIQVVATNMTMQHFVDVLGSQLHAPVVDRTGLKGSFDFSFDLDPGDATGGGTPDLAPSIITALREQLGLKIESTKLPVESFIIDSVQKPSEN